MKQLRSNRGTSIVEVLVVMVVLLVGIMTVIRLFPYGFKSVRHAENMTFASRLAQYEIERWKNNPANLPEGTLPISNPDTGDPIVLDNLSPVPPLDDEKVSSFRRIIGETTRIPFGGWSNQPVNGSFYTLAFAPIDERAPLAIRGSDLSRRIFDSDNTNGPQPWNILRSYQYAIDYDSRKICFRSVGQARVYYLTCSWWEFDPGGDPVLRTATNIKIDVAANTNNWINIPIPTGSGFLGMDAYSDTVSRGFMEIPSASSFSSDPYEYKLISSVLGIIEFNPLGFFQTEFGQQLEARIDYDILDPQIIREDKRVPTVPASEPYRVALTLNNIKEKDVTIDPDGNLYGGIYPTAGIDVDVLAVDLATALPINIAPAWINHKDGIIEFPAQVTLSTTGISVPVAGRNIRFFYKAEGDWSMQFHKAYSQFDRETDLSSHLTYKTYKITAGSPKTIYLAACNANNTISVDYECVINGQKRKIVGECHKTSDSLTNVNGQDCTYFDLKYEPTRIFSVKGVSAKARVAWRDGERWRYVDLDTILVRKPTE
ncbi:MAG TPA: hypothetical protein PLZ21_00835 [Armatimonadota bacterium]|jgi:hypothetical protein|nr:hypothetical protein [Armatimonadota bacterium]